MTDQIRRYMSKPGIEVNVKKTSDNTYLIELFGRYGVCLNQSELRLLFKRVPVKIANDDPRLLAMLDAVRISGSTWTMQSIAKQMLERLDSLDD